MNQARHVIITLSLGASLFSAQPSTAQPSTAQPSTAQPSTAQPSTVQKITLAAHTRAWIPKDHPLIGVWNGSGFTLSLLKNGEAMIQQQGVMMKQSSQDKGQVGEYLKGYWWLDSHQICLSFMLRPQCLRFKHAKHNQSKSLSLSFGREEIRLYSLIKAKG